MENIIKMNCKFVRRCHQCAACLENTTGNYSWQTMEFCKESCLFRCQSLMKRCSECNQSVEYHQLGKFATRFGYIVMQFCSKKCLDSKILKIRICSYCKKIITTVKTKHINKLFCNDTCKNIYLRMESAKKLPFLLHQRNCSICKKNKKVSIEFKYHSFSYYLCSTKCFTTFKKEHNCCMQPRKCDACWKYVLPQYLEKFAMHYDDCNRYFCTKTCQRIYVIKHSRMVSCIWCKLKKCNFDMIQKKNFMSANIFVCSLMCLNNLTATLDELLSDLHCHNCDANLGSKPNKPSEFTHVFCSRQCIVEYQNKNVVTPKFKKRNSKKAAMPVISNVCSLVPNSLPPQKTFIVIQQTMKPAIKNMCTSVEPIVSDKCCQSSQESTMITCATQTESKKGFNIVPILVPIYIPCPLPMWHLPVAKPLAFPLFIPCPILVPLTRNAAIRIMKGVNIVLPNDPRESELITIAEPIANEGRTKDGISHSSKMLTITECDESVEELSNSVKVLSDGNDNSGDSK